MRTEHGRLRQRPHGEAAAYAAGTDDPAVQRYGHLPEPTYTPTSVKTLIDGEVRAGLERGDLAVLAIAKAETNEFVGSLVIFDVSGDQAEVGFWVHPDHRGGGVGTAALDLAAQVHPPQRPQAAHGSHSHRQHRLSACPHPGRLCGDRS
ncbi:MAG: GNAT family N-acetyltransferase [Microbacterium gubbeenense]